MANELLVSKMNGLLAQMLRPSVDDFKKEITTTDDGTVTEFTRVITLEHAKKDKPTLTIKDPSLLKAIAVYEAANNGEKITSYAKCKALAMMDDSLDTIKDHGFKTTAAFAYAVFGVAQTTANKWIRVGKAWINSDLSLREWPENTPVSTMMESLSFIPNDENKIPVAGVIEGLFREGVLVDGMSQNKVELKLKEHFKPQLLEGKSNTATDDKSKNKSNTATNDKSKNKSNTATDDTVTAIDTLENMTIEQASSSMLNCLDVIENILHIKYNGDDFTRDTAIQMIDALRDVARSMVKNDNATDNK